MLHLTVAGSLEPLADALADEVAEPLADPFTPEVVVVPSAGVRDWVTRRLAERLGATGRGRDGVAANIDFTFPAALVQRVLGDDDGFGAWAVGPLTWAVHEVLVERGGELGLPADAVRARAIADLFDRYALYRQGMVLRWSDGDDVGATGSRLDDHQRWQPALWREVQARLGGGPTDAQRMAALAEALRGGPLRDEVLADVPERVFLFGLASVPSPHLDVLCALAHHRDVHVLAPVASPSRWAWVREQLDGHLPLPLLRSSEGEAARLVGPPTGGHPLVTGWGRTSREANLLLLDAAGQVADSVIVAPQLPGAPADDASVLARLQHGLRADVPLPRPDDTDARPVLDPADRSIRWLRTYGAARQVEVLRDTLLHLLEEHEADGTPRFEPRDIAVLCPDPGRFAPLVLAAFAGDEDNGVPAVPVRVADRSLRQDNPLLDAAAALLDLLDGRFRASSVLAFASRAPVRHRFGLDPDALGRISEWVEATNVRWGLDAAGQADFGLPPELDGVHTWRAGLDQLLLGATMAAGTHRLGPGDVVPVAEIEGDDVAVAGALAELVHHLGVAVAALGRPSRVTTWTTALADALASLCAVPDEDAWQWRTVRRTLDDFAAEATIDGEPRAQEVAPTDLAALLRARLTGNPGRPRFGTGAVTVSSLTAQRGVPHRVVCLLGLDADVAGGGLAAAEDLVAAEPCVGDRDPRSELRAQLLDAVLAAGERLIVCSTGHDLRTNVEVPPAVALAELFDVIDATVQGADRLIVDHPRQAWAEPAFVAGALGVDGPWSFDRRARDAAVARRRQAPLDVFLPEPLPAPEPDEGLRRGGVPILPLRHLLDACTKPAEVLLRGRLGISLPGEDERTEDQIRLRFEGLDKWKVTRGLLDAAVGSTAAGDGAAVDADTWERTERRRGGVPPLAFGDTAIAEAHERVRQLTRQLEIELSGVPHDPTRVPIEVTLAGLDGGDVIVEGEVAGVCGELVVAVTPSSLKDKDLLTAWIRLAALTCADPSRQWSSVTIGGGANGHLAVQRIALRQPERAAEVLALVADLHRRACRDAVPFFPATGRALVSGGPVAARKVWYQHFGEAEDRWIGRLFPTDLDALLALPCRADEAEVGGPDVGRVAWWAERIWGAVEETAIVEDDRSVDPPADDATGAA